MDTFWMFATRLKVVLLTKVVICSFLLSSLAWRHIESDGPKRVLVAAVILIGMYVLMIFELVNRNLAALIGAGAAVAAHDCLVRHVELEEIVQWVDLETLSLLLGMMIIVNVLSGSGLFEFLAVWSYKQSGGHFWLLVSTMALITGALSAFIDNVSTMLLMAPTLIKLSELEHIDPRYLLMMMVVFCNIGGCATPVGDPPNLIIIGDELIATLGITFSSFAAYCAPCVLLTMTITILYLRLLYKSKESFRLCNRELSDKTRQLQQLEGGEGAQGNLNSPHLCEITTDELADGLKTLPAGGSKNKPRLDVASSGRKGSRMDAGEIRELERANSIKSWPILLPSLIVLIATVLLFFLQSLPNTHLTLGWISLFAALTLLVATSSTILNHADQDGRDTKHEGEHDNFESVISKVEWSTLMFFFALFVVMEVMSKLGLIHLIGSQIVQLIELIPEGQLRDLGAISIVLWASGLASACIDNVPFTSMMVKVLGSMAMDSSGTNIKPLVFALAFGACYGGNGTLIGASANLVTAGVANRHNYPISFNSFFNFSAPITVLSLLVANIYLVVVFVVLGL